MVTPPLFAPSLIKPFFAIPLRETSFLLIIMSMLFSSSLLEGVLPLAPLAWFILPLNIAAAFVVVGNRILILDLTPTVWAISREIAGTLAFVAAGAAVPRRVGRSRRLGRLL
jgi:hypothetical protein